MSNLDEYLKNLDENTSGGSHDAVLFAGKGLKLLKSMMGLSKKAKKKDQDEKDKDQDDDRLEDDDDEEDDDEFEKNANGGDLEEEDEDPEDPADDKDDILTNHGARIPKSKLKGAVSKSYQAEEKHFQKSLDEMLLKSKDVIDAVPAVEALAKSVTTLGKSAQTGFAEIMEQNRVLAKGLEYALKSISGLSADLELIKKQPASVPSTGIYMSKSAKSGKGAKDGQRRLSKSDVEDVLTDAMNEGLVSHMTLAKAAVIHDQEDFDAFVSTLPQEVQARLNA